jgi:hypothetical protein
VVVAWPPAAAPHAANAIASTAPSEANMRRRARPAGGVMPAGAN